MHTEKGLISEVGDILHPTSLTRNIFPYIPGRVFVYLKRVWRGSINDAHLISDSPAFGENKHSLAPTFLESSASTVDLSQPLAHFAIAAA